MNLHTPCAVTQDLNRHMAEQEEGERLEAATAEENQRRRQEHIDGLKRNAEQLAAVLIDKIEFADISPALLASLIMAIAKGGSVGDESPAECAKRLIEEACAADAEVEVKTLSADDMRELELERWL